jgi:hypothetical protein
MQLKTTAVSSVLTLMFLSLLVIYLNTTGNMLITFLSVLIMLVGLIMAQSSNWRDIGILAAVSVIVSMVAVALVASARLGRVGTVIALVLWALLLLALFSSVRQSFLPLPRDRAILIRNNFTGHVYRADGPIVGPYMPFFEQIIAVMPLYELHEDLKASTLNANARHNVDEIIGRINYRVVDPLAVVQGLPNRTVAQETLAKEMNLSVDDARRNPAFWERLLGKQMLHEAEEISREIVHQNPFAQTILDIYNNRHDVAQAIKERLNPYVSRWGVHASLLEIDSVKFDRDIAKGINKASVRQDETDLRELEARRDAYRIRTVLGAESDVEGERIKAVITALKESGVDITPELVIRILSALPDWQMEGDFGLTTQNPIQIPPGVMPGRK